MELREEEDIRLLVQSGTVDWTRSSIGSDWSIVCHVTRSRLLIGGLWTGVRQERMRTPPSCGLSRMTSWQYLISLLLSATSTCRATPEQIWPSSVTPRHSECTGTFSATDLRCSGLKCSVLWRSVCSSPSITPFLYLRRTERIRTLRPHVAGDKLTLWVVEFLLALSKESSLTLTSTDLQDELYNEDDWSVRGRIGLLLADCSIVWWRSHHPTIPLSRHLTISPSHHLTIPPSHSLTIPPPHHLTISPYHHLTISPSHHLTIPAEELTLDLSSHFSSLSQQC